MISCEAFMALMGQSFCYLHGFFNIQLNHEKRKVKKKGDRYSTHTSLIVASLKRLLPVGLRNCLLSNQSLITLAKNGFTQVSCKCQTASPLMFQLKTKPSKMVSWCFCDGL